MQDTFNCQAIIEGFPKEIIGQIGRWLSITTRQQFVQAHPTVNAHFNQIELTSQQATELLGNHKFLHFAGDRRVLFNLIRKVEITSSRILDNLDNFSNCCKNLTKLSIRRDGLSLSDFITFSILVEKLPNLKEISLKFLGIDWDKLIWFDRPDMQISIYEEKLTESLAKFCKQRQKSKLKIAVYEEGAALEIIQETFKKMLTLQSDQITLPKIVHFSANRLWELAEISEINMKTYLYEKAGELGNSIALCNAGDSYLKKIPHNLEKGFSLSKKGAELGSAKAKHNLGVCYQRGLHVEKNDVLAFDWFKEAAEQGLTLSLRVVGQLYLQGIGIEKSEEEALSYFLKAARQGDQLSQEYVANICLEKAQIAAPEKASALFQEAFYWYEKLAQGGNSVAQLNVARLYETGQGVKKSITKFLFWVKLAAIQNQPNSYARLAFYYSEGIGVEKDVKKAFEYFEIAARSGDSASLYELAWRYAVGYGVQKNLDQADAWFKNAETNQTADVSIRNRFIQVIENLLEEDRIFLKERWKTLALSENSKG